MIRIAVLGATGRMGTTITRLIAGSSDFKLSGACAVAGDPDLGKDAGVVAGGTALGVVIGDSADKAVAGSDVAIDFTAAAATASNIAACVARGCALVLGTTGISDADRLALQAAAKRIAVVYARNMSVGVFVLTEAARVAARMLGRDADIEIIETHHRHKLDAPSGTALQLGEAIAAELGNRLPALAVFDRHGARAERRPGSIGFSSVRAGSLVGDHEVLFALEDELLRLEHRALDRATFARGALRSARWLQGRAAGLYGMADVLGGGSAGR